MSRRGRFRGPGWTGVLLTLLLAVLPLSASVLAPGVDAREATEGLQPLATPGTAANLPSVFGDVSLPSTTYALGPVAPGSSLLLTITLSYRHSQALAQLLGELQDPASPQFHHFLSANAFESEFGPSPAEARAVMDYFQSQGAEGMTLSADRTVLSLELPAATAERVFSTPLERLWAPQGGGFYAPASPPKLPPYLAPLVSSVTGLSEPPPTGLSTQPAPWSLNSQFDSNPYNGQQYFWGSDYQGAYGAVPLLGQGYNGSGYAVATLLYAGFDPSPSPGTNLPPFDPGAVETYFNDTLPTSLPHPVPQGVGVVVDGISPPPPGPMPFPAANADSTGAIVENSLDLEMLGSLAPGASLYDFYFAASAFLDHFQGNPVGGMVADLDAALSFNYGPDRLAAISNSWGTNDQTNPGWAQLEQKAAALGVTLFAASGDQGDAPSAVTGRAGVSAWPSFPSTATYDTYGMVAVGGSNLRLSGVPLGSYEPGQVGLPPPGYDAPNITGIASQVVWYNNGSGGTLISGTEGGISAAYNEPTWQAESAAQGEIVAASTLQGFPYARAVPDVAASANSTVIFVDENATFGDTLWTLVEGTSISSPVWAGLATLLDAATGSLQGFLDPTLYSLGGFFENVSGPLDPFQGSIPGSNYLFQSSPGWDPLTGWGSVNVTLLAEDLRTGTGLGYVYNPSATPGTALDNLPAIHPSLLPFSPYGLALLIAGGTAAAVVLIIAVVVLGRRRSRGAYGGGYPAYPPYPVVPPAMTPATGGNDWSEEVVRCPVCGLPRWADSSPCPRCGVRGPGLPPRIGPG